MTRSVAEFHPLTGSRSVVEGEVTQFSMEDGSPPASWGGTSGPWCRTRARATSGVKDPRGHRIVLFPGGHGVGSRSGYARWRSSVRRRGARWCASTSESMAAHDSVAVIGRGRGRRVERAGPHGGGRRKPTRDPVRRDRKGYTPTSSTLLRGWRTAAAGRRGGPVISEFVVSLLHVVGIRRWRGKGVAAGMEELRQFRPSSEPRDAILCPVLGGLWADVDILVGR